MNRRTFIKLAATVLASLPFMPKPKTEAEAWQFQTMWHDDCRMPTQTISATQWDSRPLTWDEMDSFRVGGWYTIRAERDGEIVVIMPENYAGWSNGKWE